MSGDPSDEGSAIGDLGGGSSDHGEQQVQEPRGRRCLTFETQAWPLVRERAGCEHASRVSDTVV